MTRLEALTEIVQGFTSPVRAARMLGVTVTGVQRMGDRGVLPYAVTPHGRLYATEDVERVRAARELLNLPSKNQ